MLVFCGVERTGIQSWVNEFVGGRLAWRSVVDTEGLRARYSIEVPDFLYGFSTARRSSIDRGGIVQPFHDDRCFLVECTFVFVLIHLLSLPPYCN